jgi:hypothetical protein
MAAPGTARGKVPPAPVLLNPSLRYTLNRNDSGRSEALLFKERERWGPGWP